MVACILLAAFSQTYSENEKQKAEWKIVKHLQFGQKNSCKIKAKEDMAAKWISDAKKKPSPLHLGNRKDALMASQN